MDIQQYRRGERGVVDVQRAENWAAMYHAGLTLQQIGDRSGVSRERVRQVLRRIKVASHEGGAAMRKTARVDGKRAAREDRARRQGVSLATLEILRANGATRAFSSQRRNARARGIAWRLTLGQWWDIWAKSGKWEQRGREKGQYVLARYRDQDAYEPFNVWVCLGSENIREARSHTKRRRGDNIFCLFPNTRKPWFAKYGTTSIGYFATREEAERAKEKWMAAHGKKPIEGRGYTVLKSGRVQVYANGRYLKTVGTVAEAIDAVRLSRLKQAGLFVAAANFLDAA